MFKYACFILTSILFCAALQARISSFGIPPQYGINEDSADWDKINPNTWEVFTSFDGDKILGNDRPSLTIAQVEYYSTLVMEGKRIGGNSIVASLSDRRGFFGGEGYMDLYWMAPVNSQYAQQGVIYGGWKYNLTNFLDLDLGGNVIYATKKVAGPGLTGSFSGESWRGDFYCGLSTDRLYLNPFAYIGYDPTYDSLKFQSGIHPTLDLEEYTGIKGLSLEGQATFGYVRSNQFSANPLPNGNDWHYSYAYVQLETQFVYQISQYRFFAGIGWTAANGGTKGPCGIDLGPDNMLWGSFGVGYIF